MERHTVMFTGDGAARLLTGFRKSGTHIRGLVEQPGIMPYSIVVILNQGQIAPVHESNSLAGCTPQNLLSHVDQEKLVLVNVPKFITGDYYAVIAWAKARQRPAAVHQQVSWSGSYVPPEL